MDVHGITDWVSRRGSQGILGLFLVAIGILVLLSAFLPRGFVGVLGLIALGSGVALVLLESRFKGKHEEKPLAAVALAAPQAKESLPKPSPAVTEVLAPSAVVPAPILAAPVSVVAPAPIVVPAPVAVAPVPVMAAAPVALATPPVAAPHAAAPNKKPIQHRFRLIGKKKSSVAATAHAPKPATVVTVKGTKGHQTKSKEPKK